MLLRVRVWNRIFQTQSVFRVAALAGCVCLLPMTVRAGDGFADALVIPKGIDIAEPDEYSDVVMPAANDLFRKRVLAAVGEEDSGDIALKPVLPSLSACFEDKRPQLERFLASSPAWRVFEVNGFRYATRRWKMENGWRYEMHGYYSAFDINTGERAGKGFPDFQTRCTLGLSGRTWVTFARDATRMPAVLSTDGESTDVELTERFGKQNSLALISAGDLIVEIFEQTPKKERNLTKATLEMIEAEASRIVAAEDWSNAAKSLPDGAIRKGPAKLYLCKMRPGIYDSFAWINPGEPGLTYVKAFEVTNGTALSAAKLLKYGSERVGWSDNPNEQYFFNTHFTIHEGDWNQFYAARFELWFKPDSGKAERKLIERIFRTEGWQR